MPRKTLAKSQPPPPPQTLQSPTQFHHTLTNLAVSQICHSTGFTSSSQTALRTLTSVTTLYLQTLAKLAATHSTNSNRTQSNLLDIVAALQDLHSVKGFAGASDLFRPLLKSSLLSGIVRFVERVDETPFAKPIPRAARLDSITGTVTNPNVEDSILKKHIPLWLPPFPDRSTYEDGELRRRREVLFPDCGSGNEMSSCGVERLKERRRSGERGCGEGEGEGEGELPAERGRVKFGFGVKRKGGMRNGVSLSNGVCVGSEMEGFRGVRDQACKEESEEEKTVTEMRKKKKKKVINGSEMAGLRGVKDPAWKDNVEEGETIKKKIVYVRRRFLSKDMDDKGIVNLKKVS